MRKSGVFFLFISLLVLTMGLAVIHASQKTEKDVNSLQKKIDILTELNLSDLCLFTEASYTRHLSQGDLYTPFQDGPLSFEHFPSGSLVPPPPVNRIENEKPH